MDNKRFNLPAGIAILFVLLVYTGFISIGPWRARGYTSDYYSRMATSFRHGQLALEEKPDPALLALPNPYDHKARKNVPVVGDASLYEGKYYLYWGPFPSVILAAVTTIVPIKPGDQIFEYLFQIGLFFLQCLFFMQIVHRFYPNLPAWIIALGICLLGLTGPYTRMLSHPFIHEAAIAGGQLFFVLGMFAAFLALKETPINTGKLFWAGFFLAACVATRTTQLVPVTFMTLLTWFYILLKYRQSGETHRLGHSTVALLSPLVVCGVILAWYNWARFDSIFEFGLYYQLAAFNLQANYDILFSRIYLIQNIYNYFFNPFEVNGSFPFFHALPGSEEPVLPTFELPNLYAVEGRFGGALISTPFLLFSLVPVAVVAATWIKRMTRKDDKASLFNLFDWMVLALLGSTIAGALPTLLLFYAGFRYETEFIASLSLLALFGFCQTYVMVKNSSAWPLIAVLGAGLAVFSILVNLALAYSGIYG